MIQRNIHLWADRPGKGCIGKQCIKTSREFVLLSLPAMETVASYKLCPPARFGSHAAPHPEMTMVAFAMLVARRVTLVVAFGFLSQLGDGEDLRMVLCLSMNAGSEVWIPWSSGDTQTLPYAKEFVWTFCTHRWWDSHLVEFPLPNFYHINVFALCIYGYYKLTYVYHNPTKERKREEERTCETATSPLK